MKKTILSLALLTAGLTLSAQESALPTFVLENFERGEVTFTETVNVNPPTEMEATIVENPSKIGENQSDKVWKWERKEATNNWAGFYATLKNEIPSGYHRIEVKYYRTDANSQLRILCQRAPGDQKEFLPVNAPSKVNEWETLMFDLKANYVTNITVFGFQPDFSTTLAVGTVAYVDDITFVYDETIEPEPVPETLVLFDNSDEEGYYDPSWSGKATTPSTLLLAGGGSDKFPVVTSPAKEGNALKLQWKSAESGDWSIMVAAKGWTHFDLTEMSAIKFYVYAEEGLSKAALPNIHLEAHSGNPNATGKVSLTNYVANDLAAATWTEVIVPLADIWATSAEFTTKNDVKGIFFSQNATDNVEHTLYIDDITFEKNNDTAIGFVKADNKNVNYYNGLLNVSDYEGMVEVYDITGHKVFAAEMTNGAVACQLQQGVYVVRYAQGASKLIIR